MQEGGARQGCSRSAGSTAAWRQGGGGADRVHPKPLDKYRYQCPGEHTAAVTQKYGSARAEVNPPPSFSIDWFCFKPNNIVSGFAAPPPPCASHLSAAPLQFHGTRQAVRDGGAYLADSHKHRCVVQKRIHPQHDTCAVQRVGVQRPHATPMFRSCQGLRQTVWQSRVPLAWAVGRAPGGSGGRSRAASFKAVPDVTVTDGPGINGACRGRAWGAHRCANPRPSPDAH